MVKLILKVVIGLLVIAILIVLGISLYGISTKKHFDALMGEYIALKIVDPNAPFTEKVNKLKNYVHDNVLPVNGEDSLDSTDLVEKLTSGIGWCDQKARVFMLLAARSGIRTKLEFLQYADGSSPHSIAEAYDGKRWVIVDPSFNLDLVNKNKELASMSDLAEDLNILKNNPKVKIFSLYSPIWNDKKFLEVYFKNPKLIYEKKPSRFSILKLHLPFLKDMTVNVASDMYAGMKKKLYKDEAKYLFFKARLFQISGQEGKAEECYKKILSKYAVSPVTDKAGFFYALLLRDSRRYKESISVLTEWVEKLKNYNWLPYYYGLRANVYKLTGDDYRAAEDFPHYAAFLDAYF